MAPPVKASMPQLLDLPDGYVIVWEAIDPSTGANVAGVKVGNVSIFGTALGSLGTTGDSVGPFLLVPGPGA